MQRAFQPETGALARKLMHSFGPLMNNQPYSAKWQATSPARGTQSPKMAQHYEAKPRAPTPFYEMPVAQRKLATSASVPNIRPALGKDVLRAPEPRAPFRRSASQSECKTASLNNLVRAAKSRMSELPSIAEAKCAGNTCATPSALQQEEQPWQMDVPQSSLMRATPSQKHTRATAAKPPPAVWNTKEENKQFADELARLGRPTEPTKWANDEVENKWLKREAVFEMFKSFMDVGNSQQDNCASTTAGDSSTRSLTPLSSNGSGGLDLEHDALSNLLGQGIMRPRR